MLRGKVEMTSKTMTYKCSDISALYNVALGLL